MIVLDPYAMGMIVLPTPPRGGNVNDDSTLAYWPRHVRIMPYENDVHNDGTDYESHKNIEQITTHPL